MITSRELEQKFQEFLKVCDVTKRDPIIELNRSIEYIRSNNKEIEYVDAIALANINPKLLVWINNNERPLSERLMDIIDFLSRTECHIVSNIGRQISAKAMQESNGSSSAIIRLPKQYKSQIEYLMKAHNLDPMIFRLIIVGEYEGHDILQEVQTEAYKYMASARRDKDGDIIYDYV